MKLYICVWCMVSSLLSSYLLGEQTNGAKVLDPLVLGGSGYTLHYSEKSGGVEKALALHSSALGVPSYSFTIEPPEVKFKVIISIDYGDRLVMLTDINGDGVPDEGFERNKSKGTLRRFIIKADFVDQPLRK